MDFGLRGRVAIVNGGSAGMGKAAAWALASEGADVFLVARGEQRLREAATEIAVLTGARVEAVPADHSSAEGRARVLAACPAPDIVVATCSPPPMTPDYRGIDADGWRSALDIGLLGPVQFMHAVLEGMVERRWGRIVNIASIAAKYPLELRILSGAPRAALANYAVAVARRVAPHNVTINTLLPGMFHTAFTEQEFAERARVAGTDVATQIAKFIAAFDIPAGRFGDPEDVGAMVALLCSRHGSYITGQSIVMDGGTTRSTF